MGRETGVVICAYWPRTQTTPSPQFSWFTLR